MAKANRAFVERNRAADDVKAGPGAKLADKSDIKAAAGLPGYVVQPEALLD